MQIIKLEVENVKRLSAVSITPDGNLVVIGGKNGAGKSSILDSIQYALAGADSLPDRPLKEGAQDGFIELDLGEFIVTREFRRQADGSVKSKVEITNKEGFKKSSPQALLDSLYGKMTFDPLEFSRLKLKEQLEQLKALVNLDFSQLEKERDEGYRARTEINRKCKEIEGQINSIELRNDIPKSEISISDLMNELSKIQANNNLAKSEINKILLLEKEINLTKESINKVEKEIKSHKEKLEILKDKLSIVQENSTLFVSDEEEEEEIKEKIKSSESINAEIRRQQHREKLVSAHAILVENHELYNSKIDEIDNEKKESLKKAKFPIPGMGFDENGVTMHGIPFSQCSSAEKLKISVSMGIALNPKLKIMHIRDGSLLDEESFQLISDMANASDTQIWIELVGKRKECSVIIEDGYIQGDERFL